MALKRMDNIGIVVDDLDAAVAFFAELGLEMQGQTTVEGPWVDTMGGLDGIRCDIAMMRTPDGTGRVELMRYQSPAAVGGTGPDTPVNTKGIRRIMFTVDDIDDVLARLLKLGAELIGEMIQYGDSYRLCNLRGPEGIHLALAQELT